MQYRPEIDGLRAVAVVPVILFHAGLPSFQGGFVGVDVFFVISGYLITGILLRELQAGSFSLASFYERRIRRILPALFFVILCCFPFAWLWLLPDEFENFCKSVISTNLFISNFWFAANQDYFAPDAELSPLLHTWSLAVEEQYYLLFPILLASCWRFGSRAVAALIIGLAALSFLLIGSPFGFDPSALFFLTWTRTWEILIGALCGWLKFKYDIRGSSAGATVGVLLILTSIFSFNDEMVFPSVLTLIPTVGSALFLLFGSKNDPVGTLLSVRPIVGIGLISYSAYLWHQPVMAFARLQFDLGSEVLPMLGLSIISLILAWLTWRFVENPFRNRSHMRWRSVGISMAVTSLVVVSLPLFALQTDASLSRYSKYEQSILKQMDVKRASRYVRARFREAELRAFNPDAKLKVMIVGDSYAQDFMNALFEAGVDDGVSFSTHYISARCGNLFLDHDIEKFIAPADKKRCQQSPRYNDKTILELVGAADVIFLASHWQTWQVQFLPESVGNIQSVSDARIVVIGRKRFGRSGDVRFNPRTFLNRSRSELAEMRTFLTEEDLMLNLQMKELLPNDIYVDFQTVVSGDKLSSPLFDDNVKLLSFDGSHLTKNGAVYVGQRLLNDPIIASALATNEARFSPVDRGD